VPREQIDERYLDSPYYLVPDHRVGQEAFAVIRDAMGGKDMVALGRIVLAKREPWWCFSRGIRPWAIIGGSAGGRLVILCSRRLNVLRLV
jgi:hypothetical protein